ncbi:response regulator [Halosegnis sp.]|uniref:sensor histidine kinase n=1 Tax=Halosegnis sp. TaxID=2864959 RepID=UPI0035D49F2E
MRGDSSDPAGGEPVNVLHVDDEPDFARMAATFVEQEHERLNVETATSASEAIERLDTGGVDCIVADYDMPQMDGLALLEAVRESHGDLPFILLTGRGNEGVASEAISAGVTDYFEKRDGTEQYTVLANRILNAVDASRMRGRLDEHKRQQESTVALLSELYDVTTDADATADEKLSRLLAIGRDWLDIPYGFLTRIDGEAGERQQRIVKSVGSHELLQPGETAPLSEAYCRHTIETEGRFAVADAVAAGWENDPAFELFELGCYVGDEVRVNGELYGTLCFAGTEPRPKPFSDWERTAVRLMVKLASYELERRRTRRELQSKNERLEEFASVVAHDLRNPLTVAEGRVELARTNGGSATKHLEEAADALARSQQLIDDLLTLARHAGELGELESVSLGAVTEACWQNLPTERARLVVERDRKLLADRRQLQQLLTNLVRNSVEHGAGGSGPDGRESTSADGTAGVAPGSTDGGSEPIVTVRVGGTDARFYVADDGPGIPPDERGRAFEAGYSTNEDGTGFGLRIVERIADAHGWSVSVMESENGGTRVDVTGVEG